MNIETKLDVFLGGSPVAPHDDFSPRNQVFRPIHSIQTLAEQSIIKIDQCQRNENEQLVVAQSIADNNLKFAERQSKLSSLQQTRDQLNRMLNETKAKCQLLENTERDLLELKANIIALQIEYDQRRLSLNEVEQQVESKINAAITIAKQQLAKAHNDSLRVIQQKQAEATQQLLNASEESRQIDIEKEQISARMDKLKTSVVEGEARLATQIALLDQALFLDLNEDMLSQCLNFTTSALLQLGMHWRLAFIAIENENNKSALFHLEVVLKSHFFPYKKAAQYHIREIKRKDATHPESHVEALSHEAQHQVCLSDTKQLHKKKSKKSDSNEAIDAQIEKCLTIKSNAESSVLETHLAMLELVALYAKKNQVEHLQAELAALNTSTAPKELKAWGFFLCGEYYRNFKMYQTAETYYQQALAKSSSFTEARYQLQMLPVNSPSTKSSESSTAFFHHSESKLKPGSTEQTSHSRYSR